MEESGAQVANDLKPKNEGNNGEIFRCKVVTGLETAC